MNFYRDRVRVLYSSPHKLGADRICYIGWEQANWLSQVGAEVLLCPGSISRALHASVRVRPTLARGKLRIPYKLLGSMRAFAWHDYVVSRRLEKLAGQIDIVHVWPLGALRTLKVAKTLGIPTVLERPNAHTRFAYEVVQKECEMLGITMPPGHEHAYKEAVLLKEEAEYALADRLLCPSDFVARTFFERGFPSEKIARHQYGFDEKVFRPLAEFNPRKSGLSVLFVGGCAPRKGVHYALRAWLKSPASQHGTLSIAGTFLPDYAEKLAPMLSHPSVKVLGHRKDVPELMRKSDILILPSIEEGSALVTSEARGSGCVLVVSEAAGAICHHMKNALVHSVGDVETIAQHLTMLHEDRALLKRLRAESLRTIPDITWAAAGKVLLKVYQETIEMKARQHRDPAEVLA